MSGSKGYYITCTEGYAINNTIFKTGQVDWKPKECRPIQNPVWRRSTEKEIKEHLDKSGYIDMRQYSFGK